MKKLLTMIVAVFVTASLLLLGGCNANTGDKTLTIAVVDGAPLLTVYNMLDEDTVVGGYKVKIKIYSGAENIGTAITSGDADAAVMPTNVGAKVFNKGADLKLLSVNIFGSLYMIGDEQITDLTALYGKIVCNIGRGGTPDMTLKYILDKNNIAYVESETAVQDKVALRYVSAGSEAIQMKKTKKCDYAVVGEPVVTQANKVLGTTVALDLQQKWAELGDNAYMQAGVFVGKSVYENQKLADALCQKLKENKALLESDYQNIKSKISAAGSSISVDFTLDTVKRLNTGFISAVDAKTKLENYYTAISEYDKTFIGGKLPEGAFYYAYKA